MLFNNAARTSLRGLSLIEALIGSALMLVVFLAIFGTYQLALILVFSTKAASGASALVNERIEYIRGLEYDSIGTLGGIPAGSIPQSEVVALNGVSYTLSTLVQYVDDPADGLDDLDETGITADYKSIRVSADWFVRGTPRSTFALTQIAPTGIESLADGGTLRVNVFDINAEPVAGALVRIVNSGTGVDVSITTGVSGSVAFPGTPPASGYEVTVTKNEFSTAQTYDATAENPNPNPGHVAVVDDTTTTISLEINELGSLTVSTWDPEGEDDFLDSFFDQALLSATTSVAVSGGALSLEGAPGSYAPSGSAASIPIAPNPLSGWRTFTWVGSTSPQASVSFTLYYHDGNNFVPIPDTDLPGNSAGLTASSVDLSGLSPATYATLQIRAALTSSDVAWTPELYEWKIDYGTGPVPIPNVDFDIRGTRTIGISAGGEPVYKFEASETTGSQGTWIITPAEADAYVPSLPSASPYAVSEQCPVSASVAPNEDASVSLTLLPKTAHSVRVVVLSGAAPVVGASVNLTGNGENETSATSSCGQTFFQSIPSGTYTITVTAAGYEVHTDAAVAVSGQTTYQALLTPTP